jgi:hypothetical protein
MGSDGTHRSIETVSPHAEKGGYEHAMKRSLGLVAFALVVMAAIDRCQAANPVFDYLTNRGVTVAPKEVVRLPPPTMADGLSAADQRKAIEGIPENNHTFEDMTRKSVVAPVVLRISQDDERQNPVGRRIDLWFVTYGNLKTLVDDEFLDSQFKSATSESDAETGSQSKNLTEACLARRGLTVPKRFEDDRYGASEFSILDKVRLNATTRSVAIQCNESVLSASILDPRFANDPEFPNRWRPITRDEDGRRVFGEPHPYSGYGAYVKVTRLAEPAGALFIEYHAAFAEPPEWFNGKNLLRSKLPIVAQHIVRQLRRGLEKTN